MNLPSYPSIYNLGHAAIADLFSGEVIVEEKVDGSQISFGVRDGQLALRSKGAEINVLAPEGMFALGVETAKALQGKLRDGWTYRGEYLAKPKHNILNYDRAPANHIILFDINTGPETYLSSDEKRAVAAELGLECVPQLFRGKIDNPADLRALLDSMSCLGGQKIEGVVIKPAAYDLFGRDKKCLFGKFVSEAFKETHAREWTKEHGTPGGKDIIGLLGQRLNTQARWAKARIHLEEAGKLEHSPRDIAMLIKEIPIDVAKECEDEIKKELFDWAWPQLRRMVIKGMPEWYKEELLKRQFETHPIAAGVQS
jgi:hypothetical protein